ncbi:MAG: SseB family protein [Actinobacteria bacterium]|nr:SseB family protein [Actinomycetota bacterium]
MSEVAPEARRSTLAAIIETGVGVPYVAARFDGPTRRLSLSLCTLDRAGTKLVVAFTTLDRLNAILPPDSSAVWMSIAELEPFVDEATILAVDVGTPGVVLLDAAQRRNLAALRDSTERQT